MVAAAARTARLLATRDVDHVVLVGTAGAYAGGPPIGTVVCASRVGLVSGTALAGRGYVPLAPPPIDAVAVPSLAGVPSLPAVPVACATAITTDPDLAARIGAVWEVEHMEAFGVARACADVGVPFSVVLGITNVVGPDAHVQWRANRAVAEAAAAGAVRAWLA
jgi:purine-nucleoside phosphorylase